MNNKKNYDYLLSDLTKLKGVGSKIANLLKKNGFKDISVIQGGITDWVKNGNDIVYPKLD